MGISFWYQGIQFTSEEYIELIKRYQTTQQNFSLIILIKFPSFDNQIDNMICKSLKFALLLKALILVPVLAFSQSIHLNFNDGSSSVYQIEDIRKITFENEMFNLHLFDGSIYSWDVNSIQSNHFELPSLNVQELINDINNWNTVVYPNPTSDVVYIQHDSKIEEDVTVKIFDQQGVLKSESKFRSNKLDKSIFMMDISPLPVGVYVCSISTPNHTTTKLIHKK